MSQTRAVCRLILLSEQTLAADYGAGEHKGRCRSSFVLKASQLLHVSWWQGLEDTCIPSALICQLLSQPLLGFPLGLLPVRPAALTLPDPLLLKIFKLQELKGFDIFQNT